MRNHSVSIKGWVAEEPRIAISEGQVCAILMVRNSTDIKDGSGTLQGRKAELTPVMTYGFEKSQYVVNTIQSGDFVAVKGGVDMFSPSTSQEGHNHQDIVVADSIAKAPLARTSNTFSITGQVGLDPQIGYDQHSKNKYHEVAVSTVAVLWDSPQGEQKGRWQSFTIPVSEQTKEFISELKSGDTVKLEGQFRSFKGFDFDLGKVAITKNLQVDSFELLEKAKQKPMHAQLEIVKPDYGRTGVNEEKNRQSFDMVPY